MFLHKVGPFYTRAKYNFLNFIEQTNPGNQILFRLHLIFLILLFTFFINRPWNHLNVLFMALLYETRRY